MTTPMTDARIAELRGYLIDNGDIYLDEARECLDEIERLRAEVATETKARMQAQEIIKDDRKYLERIGTILGIGDSCLAFSDIVNAARASRAEVQRLRAALQAEACHQFYHCEDGCYPVRSVCGLKFRVTENADGTLTAEEVQP